MGEDTRDGDDGMRYGQGEPEPMDELERAIQEEGAGRGSFDPTPYMRQLRGRGGQGQEYLDVKWRLLWLRREHPDAEIVTEHVRIDDGIAIFKATVTLPAGGKATGYGSETAGDFGDFIEKAETKAIGRALNALGYGAQFSERADEEGNGAAPQIRSAQPAPERAPATRSEPPRAIQPPAAPGASSTVGPASEPAGAPASDTQSVQEPPAPVPFRPAAERGPASTVRTGSVTPVAPQDSARRERGETPAPANRGPRPVPVASPAERGAESPPGEDDDMAEISWNAFWTWARTLGYRRKEDVESFLGRSVNDLTPGEVRALIRERRGDA